MKTRAVHTNSTTKMASKVLLVAVFIVCTFWGFAESSKDKEEKEKTKINKNILDYSESDVYRLLDQWDVSNSYFFFVYMYSVPESRCIYIYRVWHILIQLSLVSLTNIWRENIFVARTRVCNSVVVFIRLYITLKKHEHAVVPVYVLYLTSWPACQPP